MWEGGGIDCVCMSVCIWWMYMCVGSTVCVLVDVYIYVCVEWDRRCVYLVDV